ncbi:MAG TPA: endo-1,4-beta-xylanase [Marinagarivorans sp.]
MNKHFFTKTRSLIALTSIFAALGLTVGCSQSPQKEMTLKEAYEPYFLVGGTVGETMLLAKRDPSLELAKEQFAVLTTANSFKWAVMNPEPSVYNFDVMDRFVDFGQKNNISLIGHVLFWHSQTPDWVFEDENGNLLTREALLERMRERAKLMADRYGDTIKVWDVVNEAITDDGALRQTKFHKIIGDDFVEQAFRIAEEVFPEDSVFLYNDYNMMLPERRATVIAMVEDFKARGVKIDGIGVQGHWALDNPTLDELDLMLTEFASTGLPIHITEMDIDYLGREQYFGANVDIEKLTATPENNPYPDGNFPAEADAALAARYGEVFKVFLNHADHIERVTFWGITDADSWLNGWPVKGRTNYPLLFDREWKAKPAVKTLVDLAVEKTNASVSQ